MRTPFIALLCLGAVSLTASIGATRLRLAQHRVDDAQGRLDRVTADAREVVELRAVGASAALGEPPQEDLLARLTHAASACGLQRSVIRGVRLDADRPTAGDPLYRQRRFTATLQPIDPPALGRFLDRWRSTEPVWSISSIALNVERARRPAGVAPSYAATIQLTATYAAEAAGNQP